MAALVALGGVALYPALASDRYAPLVAAVGGLALLLLATALAARSQAAVAWAVAVAGTEYAVFLGVREGEVDAWAPLVGVALFVVAELGCRSTESSHAAPERSVVLRSILSLSGTVVGVVALGAILLAVAGGAESGLALEALGVAAAVVALTMLVVVVARTSGRAESR